jgi:hypothetical protein
MEHTKTLKLVFDGDADKCRPAIIHGDFATIVVDCGENWGDPKPLAELIIKACNAYDSDQQTIKGLLETLKSIQDWFNRMKSDHHEKLVNGQTFESACENWDKLLQEPFDMGIIEQAIAKASKP